MFYSPFKKLYCSHGGKLTFACFYNITMQFLIVVSFVVLQYNIQCHLTGLGEFLLGCQIQQRSPHHLQSGAGSFCSGWDADHQWPECHNAPFICVIQSHNVCIQSMLPYIQCTPYCWRGSETEKACSTIVSGTKSSSTQSRKSQLLVSLP